MHEIFNTRNNPQIDPILSIWGWDVAMYLFLGGFTAGVMIIVGWFVFSGRQKNENCSCSFMPLVGIIAMSIGMVFLFMDLENKFNVWRFYTTFRIASPMSWGAWILLLVYPVLAILTFVKPMKLLEKILPQTGKISEFLNNRNKLVKVIGSSSMVIGAMLGMYTGVLLSTFAARPLWNSSMLWVLFLVSGLSSAAAFIHLVAKNAQESKLLAKADNGLLIFELLILFLILIGFIGSTQVHQEAVQVLLTGQYAAAFWVLVVGIGIVIPLIIQLFAVNDKINHTAIAPIMVILGGLALRFIIVNAGQYSSWSMNVIP